MSNEILHGFPSDDKILDIVHGCHVSYVHDPEDNEIVYLRVFGVPDDEVTDVKLRLWEIIDTTNAPFIPSVVSLSDTQSHYPHFLYPIDFDSALPEGLMQLISGITEMPNLSSTDAELPSPSFCTNLSPVLRNINEVSHAHDFRLAA